MYWGTLLSGVTRNNAPISMPSVTKCLPVFIWAVRCDIASLDVNLLQRPRPWSDDDSKGSSTTYYVWRSVTISLQRIYRHE